jgi:hypothetical protein
MLGGCRVYILIRDVPFFSTIKNQDPPTFCCKWQEAWGLHSVSVLFSKKRTSLKRLLQDRTISRLHVERTRNKLDSSCKAGETKRSSKFNREMFGGLSMRPTGFSSDVTTNRGPWPGPRAEVRRGAASATPTPSRIG